MQTSAESAHIQSLIVCVFVKSFIVRSVIVCSKSSILLYNKCLYQYVNSLCKYSL